MKTISAGTAPGPGSQPAPPPAPPPVEPSNPEPVHSPEDPEKGRVKTPGEGKPEHPGG